MPRPIYFCLVCNKTLPSFKCDICESKEEISIIDLNKESKESRKSQYHNKSYRNIAKRK